MFLTFDQVTLVQDKKKRQPGDGVVYLDSERRLWVDYADTFFGPEKPFPRYGTVYQDAAERWCVIPDNWSLEEVSCAKDFVAQELPESQQEIEA